MRDPLRQYLCSFCNKPPKIAFRSRIGGEPPIICSECVRSYKQTLDALDRETVKGRD